MTTTQAVEHHVGTDDIDTARRTLAWLDREINRRDYERCSRLNGGAAAGPAFEPIRVVADTDLQFDDVAMTRLHDAVMQLGCLPFEPAYPAPGGVIGVELVLHHQPTALAASNNPKHPDAPDLWLANLRAELRPAVTEGWVLLDPPWPGTSTWQRARERWEATHHDGA